MQKPRELKPRPRNFKPAGWKKFGSSKPEVQPATDDQEDPNERREAEQQDAR